MTAAEIFLPPMIPEMQMRDEKQEETFMRKYYSDEELRKVLGTYLEDSDVIDTRIEETYGMIRNAGKKSDGRGRRHRNSWRGVGITFGSIAAALVLTFTFCAMNPVMAKEIPVLGGLFARVADIFSFGQLPEEETTELYTVQGEELPESGEAALKQEQYQKSDNGLTVTLTQEYASNQAIYVGVRIENEEAFPQMAVLEGGTQTMRLKTNERYSFRTKDSEAMSCERDVEGKFEDANTFIGIMRIDYSEIDTDESKYLAALQEMEAQGKELPLTDENYFDYMEKYEVPESFTMDWEITQIVGYLAEPTRPEGTKSNAELEQMTDEEWRAYMETLPQDWYSFPNRYENWWKDGFWKFDLAIAQREENTRVIQVNETNADGVGLESLEISPVEMTMNVIEPAGVMTFAVALDADGNKIENGSGNAYELAIEGHDISKVYVYICEYTEYMDEIKGYGVSGNHSDRSFQEVLEERALFRTVVDTK